jgi:hypothetical protein
MHGAIPPLHNTALWRVVDLRNTQGQLYLYLILLGLLLIKSRLNKNSDLISTELK